MSALESSALFKERALNFGLSQAVITTLVARGYDTFGKLAFCSAYRPGQSDEAPLMAALATILGRQVRDDEAPALRRLHFEASTMIMSDMKSRVERTDASEPKRLPMAERTARLEKQKADLVGVVINQENEPSHQLVDRVFQQLEDGCVVWIPWEQLSSRAKETQSAKKELQFKLDHTGNLKASQKDEVAETNLSGDIRVRQALQRRALAYDLSKMVTYRALETWTERLFSTMLLEPPQGYKAVTMRQVLEADKKLWQLISEHTRGRVAMQPDDSRPVELSLEHYSTSHEVTFLLNPLPKSSGKQDDRDPKDPKIKLKVDPKVKKGAFYKEKKDKKDKREFTMPDGASSHTPEGKPICRNWNQGRCRFAEAGKRCKFGMHLCWKCFRPKGAHECTHS